ncbi:MAG: peptidoglycan editing factor PgeF [Endomicrobium sp.]|jgi:YfiH family protein|nr:peptidoglycan editing factor PgeF [Endomicrobium sp.]
MSANIVVCRSFKFPHFTTTKSCGDMKDAPVRNAFLASLKINPVDLVLAKQIHSNTVKIVSKKDGGKFLDGCDGFITDEKNLALGIFTADCMPVMLCSKDGRVKAALHCGWKGLACAILEKAVGIFKTDFGADAKTLCAYIAPHIKECCYETGGEFEDIFNIKLKNSKLNMAEIACVKLNKMGVKNIAVSIDCTFCGGDKFFSYRKNKTDKRQLTVLL